MIKTITLLLAMAIMPTMATAGGELEIDITIIDNNTSKELLHHKLYTIPGLAVAFKVGTESTYLDEQSLEISSKFSGFSGVIKTSQANKGTLIEVNIDDQNSSNTLNIMGTKVVVNGDKYVKEYNLNGSTRTLTIKVSKFHYQAKT